MPTIKGAITISVASAATALKNPTYSEVLVVGEHTDNTKYNDPTLYTSQADVITDFTSGAIVETTANIFAQGVQHLRVVNVYKDAETPKDYATVLTALETENIPRDIIVGTIDADDVSIGLLVTHANTYYKVLVIPAVDTKDNVLTDFNAIDDSKFLFGIAHDDTVTPLYAYELGGAAAGVLAQCKPWIPPEWHSVEGINAAGYTEAEVAAIEAIFVNTVTDIVGASISGAFAHKTGCYIDVTRTERWLADSILVALTNLKYRLANMNRKIPYSPRGLGMIKAEIEKVMRVNQGPFLAIREDYTDDDGEFVPGFAVQMPVWADISDADKANRTLTGIEVIIYYNGSVSTISLTLIVTV